MVNEATTAQSVVPDKLLTPHMKSLHVESSSTFVHATHTTHAPTATVDSFSLLTLDIMDVHAPPAPGQCRWPHTYLMLLLLRTGTHASSRARPCTRADRRCEHHFLCLRGPSLGPLASCDHQHACRRGHAECHTAGDSDGGVRQPLGRHAVLCETESIPAAAAAGSLEQLRRAVPPSYHHMQSVCSSM